VEVSVKFSDCASTVFPSIIVFFQLVLISQSTLGTSKSIEDTQKVAKMCLPLLDAQDKGKCRAAFIVHKLPTSNEDSGQNEGAASYGELLGFVSLRPAQTIPLPDHFSVADGPETGTLKVEVGYMFLPTSWGHGYATEAVKAAIDAYKDARDFWSPFTRLYVEAIVGEANPSSVRVLEKAGLKRMGLHKWDGEPVFLAGAWRECQVLVYGTWLVE
jgi:RimJ/RimL family protein N-acetyltransferase